VSTRSDAPRPRCPRCGARLGALDAGAASTASGTFDDAPSRWFCGCCGLVLDAPRA
jgi:ribosomal protein S27AE